MSYQVIGAHDDVELVAHAKRPQLPSIVVHEGSAFGSSSSSSSSSSSAAQAAKLKKYAVGFTVLLLGVLFVSMAISGSQVSTIPLEGAGPGEGNSVDSESMNFDSLGRYIMLNFD